MLKIININIIIVVTVINILFSGICFGKDDSISDKNVSELYSAIINEYNEWYQEEEVKINFDVITNEKDKCEFYAYNDSKAKTFVSIVGKDNKIHNIKIVFTPSADYDITPVMYGYVKKIIGISEFGEGEIISKDEINGINKSVTRCRLSNGDVIYIYHIVNWSENAMINGTMFTDIICKNIYEFR